MIQKVIQKLRKVGFSEENIQQVALWLLCSVTNKSNTEIVLNDNVLSHDEEVSLDGLIYDLVVKNKPLQYILGTVFFCDMELSVEVPILIPRPETEEWVINIIDRYKKKVQLEVLDLCTGSGCIALACAKYLKDVQVLGSDISSRALVLAQKNKKQLKIENVTFVQSDLFEEIDGNQFDIIISNPPYISEDEWRMLEPCVKDWEDKRALVAENKGLALVERIIREARFYLKKNSEALLILEIGYSQAEVVCTLLRSYGYTNIEVLKDFSGHNRVVMGRYVAEKS